MMSFTESYDTETLKSTNKWEDFCQIPGVGQLGGFSSFSLLNRLLIRMKSKCIAKEIE